MTANVPSKPRRCPDCDVMTVVMWYTKRGRMNVMCMKCGKNWETRASKEDEESKWPNHTG